MRSEAVYELMTDEGETTDRCRMTEAEARATGLRWVRATELCECGAELDEGTRLCDDCCYERELAAARP